MENYLLDAFREFSQAAAPVVVAALWQGAVLACGLAVCLRFVTRASAAHRFAIWAAGFAVVVCLPVLPFLMGAFSGGGGAGTFSSGAGSSSSGPLLRLDLRWSLVIGALWVAASIARAVDLGIHSLRLRKLWKTSRPVEVGDFVLSHPSAMKPRKDGAPGFEICTTTELDRPSVIGFFAPRILIPEWLFARLTQEELEHLVLHESEHLRRHDDWTNLIQKFCLVVFPLNPALAWMERRLCREREMACDDGVVRATQAPRAYAACLASLAERGLERRAETVLGALSLGAWQRRPELVERVHRILRRTPGLSPLAATALVSGMGCGLVAGSIEFARCPQLVAFVPAVRVGARQDVAELGDARFTDASFVNGRSGNAAGFHAVDAVAHVPVGSVGSAHTVIADGGAYRSPTLATEKSRKDGARGIIDGTAGSRATGWTRTDWTREMKTASVAGDGSAPDQERPAQQWIVFTAWEQVESAGADSPGSDSPNEGSRQDSRLETGLRQDYDSTPTADQAAKDGATLAGHKNVVSDTNSGATSRITVTQLILRIYTTGSDSTSSTDQPAIVPLRDGWFVFQL